MSHRISSMRSQEFEYFDWLQIKSRSNLLCNRIMFASKLHSCFLFISEYGRLISLLSGRIKDVISTVSYEIHIRLNGHAAPGFWFKDACSWRFRTSLSRFFIYLIRQQYLSKYTYTLTANQLLASGSRTLVVQSSRFLTWLSRYSYQKTKNGLWMIQIVSYWSKDPEMSPFFIFPSYFRSMSEQKNVTSNLSIPSLSLSCTGCWKNVFLALHYPLCKDSRYSRGPLSFLYFIDWKLWLEYFMYSAIHDVIENMIDAEGFLTFDTHTRIVQISQKPVIFWEGVTVIFYRVTVTVSSLIAVFSIKFHS